MLKMTHSSVDCSFGDCSFETDVTNEKRNEKNEKK